MNEWFDAGAPVWRLAGWTMLHFLWAGALVAALGAAARIACRRASPAVRYGASLAMLAAIAVTPVAVAAILARDPAMWEESASRRDAATVGESLRDSHSAANQELLAGDDVAPEFASRRDAATVGESLRDSHLAEVEGGAVPRPSLGEHESPIAANVAAPEESTSRRDAATVGESLRDSHSMDIAQSPWALVVAWLPALWLVGAPLTFAWLAAGLVGSRRLRSRSLSLESGPAFDACQRLAKSLGVAQRVVVASCERIVQPVLVGIVRPVILLPAAALAGWTPEELEMVLVHELAHVRRWDNLVNFGQRVVESLLFFHPCVWLASRQVRRDREECCDALVVRHTQRPEAYATLLVSIAATVRGRQPAALAAASALGGHPLKSRVRRILKLEDETMRVSRGTVGAAAALILAMLATAVLLPAGGASQADEATENGEIVSYRKVYSKAKLREIDFLTWNELIEKDREQVRVSVDPLDADDVDVIAPPRVHDQIAELLEKASAARVAEGFERARADKDATIAAANGKALERAAAEELRARLREEIARISAQIKEIDVMKQVSLQQHWDIDFSLDKVIATALANDASAVALQNELKELEAQMRDRAAAGNFRTDPEFKRLNDTYGELEQKYRRIYGNLVKQARTFAGDHADDLKRTVVFGIDTKLALYEAQKQKLEKDLQAVEAQLAEPDEKTRATKSFDSHEAYGEVEPYFVRYHVPAWPAFKPGFWEDFANERDVAIQLDEEDGDRWMTVRAPKAVHREIEVLLDSNREDLGAVLDSVRDELQKNLAKLNARKREKGQGSLEFKLTKLRGDIALYQKQIVRIDEQLAELELQKQRALEQAQSPEALEEAVQAAVDKDPTVNMYREQLFQLELQIQAMAASEKNAAYPQLKRLQASYAQLEQMMHAAEAKVREAAKERLQKLPNEALRAAIVDYNVKKQFYEKQKQESEAKLKAAEQKLAELSKVDPEIEMLEREIESQQRLVQNLEQKIEEWRAGQKGREQLTQAAAEGRSPPAQVELTPGRRVAPGEVLMTIEDGHTWVAFPAGVPKSVAEKSLAELQAAGGWELEDVDGRWRLKGRRDAGDDSDSITIPRSNKLLSSLFLELTNLEGERAVVEAHLKALQRDSADDGDEPSAALDSEIESHPIVLDFRASIDALRRKKEEYELAVPDSHDLESDATYQRIEASLEKESEALDKFEDTLREQLLEERKQAVRAANEKKENELKQRLADIDAKRPVLEKKFNELTVAAQRGDSTSAAKSEATEHYDSGVKLLKERQPREALAAFTRALAADSTFAIAYAGKGDALKAMQLYPEAAAAYSQVLQYDTNSSAAYSRRAECFLAMTPPAYDLAMNDFQNALNLDRENAAALAGLGHVYVATGQDPKRAVALLDEALHIDPQFARAFRDRGLAYAQLREMDQAVADLQRAIELDPGDYENFSTLATVQLFNKNPSEAIDALTSAIGAYKRRGPGEPSIHLMGYLARASARLTLAESEADAEKRTALLEAAIADADAVLAKYADRFPESGQALFRRGKVQRLLQRHRDAVDSLTQAIELVPETEAVDYLPTAHLLRGLSWYELGSLDLAQQELDQLSGAFGLTSVESLQSVLNRVTAQLERAQQRVAQQPGYHPDDEEVESLRKLEATLRKMVVDLQTRGKVRPQTTRPKTTELGERPKQPPQKTATLKSEPRLFAYARLLGEAPELGVSWSKEWGPDGENVTLHAPQPVQNALALVEGFLERVEESPRALAKEPLPMSSTGEEDDGPEAYEEFHDLFRPSDDNPQVTMTHSVEAFDKLVGFDGAMRDILMGLVKDIYGPKLPIEVKPIDDGKRLEVTAAQGGQAWLRLVLAEGSPVPKAIVQQREAAQAAEEAAEAADAANPHAAVAGTAVDSSREGDEPQRPWVWRAAEWPADVTPEDKERIARELAQAGVRVEMSRVPDSARFAFAIRGKPGQAPNSALVWEERMVDGQPRKTARVVFSFSLGFGRQGPQQRRSLRIVARPGMTFDDMLAIAKDLEAAGHEATLLKTDPVALDVRTPLQNPKPVWETRIVDGKPRTVMQLVDQPGADGVDPQEPARQAQPDEAAAENRGAVQPRPQTHEEAVRALRGNFLPADSNPVETVNYATNSLFLEIVEQAALALDGRRLEDAAEPLRFEVRPGPAGALPSTQITAPRKAHEYFKPLFTIDFREPSPAGGTHAKPKPIDVHTATLGDSTIKTYSGVPELTQTVRLCDLLQAQGLRVSSARKGDAWTVTAVRDADAAGDGNPSPGPSLQGKGNGNGAVRLAPGSKVYLRALNALPDAPLDGDYTIEAEGTIPLGAYYGRVAVAGLTVIEAEAAIKKHLETILTNPELQLTLMPPSTIRNEPLRASGKLADGDAIGMSVLGALPDQPLRGKFVIEPGGTVALGPAYGRVAIAGLTVQEAEKAIATHLRTILTNAEVQVTFAGSPEAPIRGPEQPRVRVIQPALARGGSRVTAYVELTPQAVEQAAATSPLETQRQRAAYSALAKSQLLLQAALARPGISDLSAVRAHAGEELLWLMDELEVAFSKESPVMEFRLDLSRGSAADYVKLLNAIIAEFKDAVESEEFQATLRGAAGAKAAVSAVPPAPSFRYDGKSFDEWAALWQTELMPERRNTAIRAFAAFARVGKGREAAEALLDVAGQYNFNSVPTGPTGAEGELKRNVVELLAGNDGSGVAPTDWLPPLMERLAEDPDKWRPLAGQVLRRLTSADAKTRDLLLGYAQDSKYGPNAMVLRALATTTREGDPRQAEVETLLRAALAGDDAKNSLELFKFLGDSHVHDWPEAFNLLFHSDLEVRKAARATLQVRSNLSEYLDPRRAQYDALLEKLYAVIEDPQRGADHADAWRTVAMLRPYIQAMPTAMAATGAKLERAFEAGDPAGLTAAIVTATQLVPDESLKDFYNTLPEDRRKLVADQLNAEAIQAEREFRGLSSGPQPFSPGG